MKKYLHYYYIECNYTNLCHPAGDDNVSSPAAFIIQWTADNGNEIFM